MNVTSQANTRSHTLGIAAVILATVLAGAAVFAYTHRGAGDVEATKQIGLRLVDAIERYRSDTGEYPPQLDALVPKYLPQVERPVWGLGVWNYRRFDQQVQTAGGSDTTAHFFDLSVSENEANYPLLFYDITLRQWVLNN